MTKKTDDMTELEAQVVEQVVGSDSVLLEEAPDSLYVHTFEKPIEYNGKTYEKLTFDFDSLCGGDSLDVESELLSKGHFVVSRSVDPEYLIRMCARACTDSVGFDIFRCMKVKDYTRITNYSRRFF